MIPNIFISSTIQDLHYLRDAIRDTVLELTYNPVMSEYGDIGYLPTSSAEDSCYKTMTQCQLAVVIIGKRYSHLSSNDLSVTHNEFRVAREQRLPVICLVDSEVLAFKQVFDANKEKESLSAPGMDRPAKTFEFLNEFTSSPVNNGVLPYTNVSDARLHLKQQIAHLFGEFLRGQFDPIKAEIKDILSEIKTLRHEMAGQTGKADGRFLKAARFLVDDTAKPYTDFIQKYLKRSIDQAIPIMLESSSFDDVVQSISEQELQTVKPISKDAIQSFREKRNDIVHSTTASSIEYSKNWLFFIARTKSDKILVNPIALKELRSLHQKFLEEVK